MTSFQVIQVLIAGAVFLWGLPIAWQHWSAERRWAARIERNGKIIAQAENQSEVIRLLRADNAQLALRRAALNAVPTRWRAVWLVVGGMTIWLIPFALSLKAQAPVTGTTEQLIRWAMAAIGGAIIGLGVVDVNSVRKLRRSWIDNGGPAKWEPKRSGCIFWSRECVEIVEPSKDAE